MQFPLHYVGAGSPEAGLAIHQIEIPQTLEAGVKPQGAQFVVGLSIATPPILERLGIIDAKAVLTASE